MTVPSSVVGSNAAVAIHFTHVTKGDSGRLRESVGIDIYLRHKAEQGRRNRDLFLHLSSRAAVITSQLSF